MDAPTTAAAPTTKSAVAYVRAAPAAPVSPPLATVGALACCSERLFPNVGSSLMTILVVLLLIWSVPPLVDFLIVNAVWTGSDREACLATAARPDVGACWAYIGDRLAYIVYGSYPVAGRWR